MTAALPCLLLCVGCYATTDHDRLRRIESELTVAKGDLFFYKLGTAPIGSSAVIVATGAKVEDHIERALHETRRLLGEEDE